MRISEFGQWRPQDWALTIVLACGGLLSIALVMELAFEMVPCPLCLMQRIWVFVVGLSAYVSLIHNPRWGIYPLITATGAIIGGGFSIRQLWLQSLPPDEVPACGPDITYMIDAFPLVDLLAAMTSGTGDCAEVTWSFVGLSIPGWLLVGFVLLLAMAVMQMRSGMRHH